MRPRLGHTMQIDPGVDVFSPAGQLRSLPTGK
jgi:hypothetical protein